MLNRHYTAFLKVWDKVKRILFLPTPPQSKDFPEDLSGKKYEIISEKESVSQLRIDPLITIDYSVEQPLLHFG